MVSKTDHSEEHILARFADAAQASRQHRRAAFRGEGLSANKKEAPLEAPPT
jgi:hypothetical protein